MEFDWEFYCNYYEDLRKAGINTKEKALNHWNRHGEKEGRISFDFDWKFYINYYNLIYIKNKEKALEHYIKYGKKEQHFYSLNHKYKNYKFLKIENNNENIIDIPIYNYVNEPLIQCGFNFIKQKYNQPGIIIYNEDISSDFLKYSKYKVKDLFDNSNFDIIHLTYDFDFFECIKNEINVYPCNNINFNCVYLTQSGVDKLNKNPNLNNLIQGYYSRPLFNYKKDSIIKSLWESYYRVTSYFNKIYCINLAIEPNKKKDMQLYCNLLNFKENDFFYEGIFGPTLPSLNELVELNYYNKAALNKNLKIGTIGLSITQLNIFKEAIQNNYNNILLLEDDISFPLDYFLVLDKIFNKYSDIDILYLGCSNYDKNNVLEKIDQIHKYNLYKPKNVLQKVCIGGMFAVYLSKKAINIFYERFKIINNISDILLCDIAFDIMNDFDSTEMIKTNYNLNTIFINKNLFDVNINKPSLTEENDFKMFNILDNKKTQYLIKIKKLDFLLKSNQPIKIKISENMKLWYSRFITLFLSLFANYIEVNNEPHINLYTYHCKSYNKDCLNIMINGEKADDKNNTDIAILTTKKQTFGYNIYFPQMFSSLWERKQSISTNQRLIGCNNTKEHFCAYMYSYDLEYRVKLFNEINKYKKVDALGKSCNKIVEDSRSVYTDTITYNDIAVEKYSKYKFVLALENGIEEGYFTEKILNPLLANSIPIYAGPSDVFNIINKKRIIYIYDFKNTNDLIEYIKLVDNDDDLYNSIINNDIWISDLNLDTYENYILNELKKSIWDLKS